MALLLGLTVWWSVRSTGEIAALNSMVTSVSGRSAEAKVAFRLGWPVLTIARWVTAATADEPELGELLKQVRRVEVSVSELKGTALPGASQVVMGKADTMLAAAGWQRAVGVLEREQVVGVYVPIADPAGENMEFLVVVYDTTDLVIVKAKCGLEGVLAVIEQKMAGKNRVALAAAN